MRPNEAEGNDRLVIGMSSQTLREVEAGRAAYRDFGGAQAELNNYC